MKQRNGSFFQPHVLIKPILLGLGLISFGCSAFAAGPPRITDAEITRAARIAKATGTNITIVRERVTVKISSNKKKSRTKSKKLYQHYMNQNEPDNSLEDEDGQSSYEPVPRPRKRTVIMPRPPVLRERPSPVTQPPVVPGNAGILRPPVLDQPPYPGDASDY